MTVEDFTDLDRALEEADHWVAETAKNLGQGGLRRGHSSLRAVLQAVRDYLPFEEAVNLSNHLPALIRGVYLEGWNPSPQLPSPVTREAILARIEERLPRPRFI